MLLLALTGQKFLFFLDDTIDVKVRETGPEELGALLWPHETVRRQNHNKNLQSRKKSWVGFGIRSLLVKKLDQFMSGFFSHPVQTWVITLHVQLKEEEAELLTLLFLTQRDSLRSGLADCWHQRDFTTEIKFCWSRRFFFPPPFSRPWIIKSTLLPDRVKSRLVFVACCCGVSVINWSRGIKRSCLLQVGLVYMFNLIVGTGALTMPRAFATAGWVVSLALISFLGFMRYESVPASSSVTSLPFLRQRRLKAHFSPFTYENVYVRFKQWFPHCPHTSTRALRWHGC